MICHILFIIYCTKPSYILVNSLTLKLRGISLLQLEENLGEVARTLLCFTNKNKNILTWDIDGTISYEKIQESVSFRVWEIYIRCLSCVKISWSHLWVWVGFFVVYGWSFMFSLWCSWTLRTYIGPGSVNSRWVGLVTGGYVRLWGLGSWWPLGLPTAPNLADPMDADLWPIVGFRNGPERLGWRDGDSSSPPWFY